MVRERVAGRRDRLDLGVAELDDLAVGERVVVELDAGAGRQVGASRRCARPAPACPETWSACTCVSKHGDDRDALRLGQRDVVVDEVDVRVDDRELRCASRSRAGMRRTRSRRSAAVGSTRRPPGRIAGQRLDKLSSDLLNSKTDGFQRTQKNALFEAIALMGKAFASPRRLELLDLLAQAPRTRRRARARERAVHGEHLPAPAGAARGGDGHAHARRHQRALRARRRRGAARCGWRCATPRSRGWPRSSAPRATTSARTSRRSDATS